MSALPRCWCGETDLQPWGADYLDCPSCGTLVRRDMPTTDVTRVCDEETDLYGRNYWIDHQRELGNPTLKERSVSDLTERCAYWLDAVLAYRPPPARVLDLGASHGGFVALLEQAGYDATGLEISPWVAAFARRAFAVTMLEGPIEDHDLPPGSFDIVVVNDVLEHLPDPVGTVGRCCELLPEDGILLVQTPCRPEGVSPERLHTEDHPFARMLLPEHLFLFNQTAIGDLLHRLGFEYLVFEPPAFDTDLFAVAGRSPLERIDDAIVARKLREREGGGLSLSLLDAARFRRRLEREYLRADADRIGRQEQIDSLRRTLDERTAEWESRRLRLAEEKQSLETARAELLERLAILEARIRDLREEHLRARESAENDRRTIADLRDDAERMNQTVDRIKETAASLRRDLEISEHDALEKQNRIDVLEGTVESLRRDLEISEHDALERQNRIDILEGTVESLRQDLEISEHDALEKQNRIDVLEGTVESLRRDLEAAERTDQENRLRVDGLRGELDRATEAVESARRELGDSQTEARRLAVELEEQRKTLETYVSAVADHNEHSARLSERLRTVRSLIDNYRRSRLYRLMVRSGRWRHFDDLMGRALSGRLTPAYAAREADLDGDETWVIPSSSRIVDSSLRPTIAVDLTALLSGAENGGAKLVATELIRMLADLAPERDFLLLTGEECHLELATLDRDNVRRRRTDGHPWELTEILEEEPIALLFSPMTAPPFRDPRVPVVSVVHDLQVYTYPDFFTDEDRAERDRAFRNAVAWSDRIVTVSDYVRTTVLEHSGLPSDRVVTIHNGLADRLVEPGAGEIDEVLGRYGLEANEYLLYPANFWSHKNHRMLLTAFSLYTHEKPATGLRLVLTGADRPDCGPLRDAARQMGLDGRVVIPGFVPEADLASLLAGCRALVFPSLYEGFGIPVTEAMSVGRPVICSQTTSLPEVAGEAALMIDPRKPDELAAAIDRVSSDDDLVADLVNRGLQRVNALGGRRRMARAYLDLFDAVLSEPRRFTDSLAGVFPDRWTGCGFVVGYGEGTSELRLGLANQREDAVALSTTVGSFSRHVVLGPQQRLELTCRLPDPSGYLEFAVSSTFCPAERSPSLDTRHLGLRLEACFLSGDNQTDLLGELGVG